MTMPHDLTSSIQKEDILPPRSPKKQFSSAAEALLPTALSAAVPLWVSTIYERGGPTREDWARLPQLGRMIAEQGDRLLYRGSREGETANLFNAIAEALAFCSFARGGISFAGQQFDALQILTFFLGAEKAEQYVAEVRQRNGTGDEQ